MSAHGRWPRDRDAFLAWLGRFHHDSDAIVVERDFASRHAAQQALEAVLQSLIEGSDPAPHRVRIDALTERGRKRMDVQISFQTPHPNRATPLTVRMTCRKVPAGAVQTMRDLFPEYMVDRVKINEGVARTTQNMQGLTTIRDSKGKPITTAEADDMTRQHLVHNLPLIVDLCRFIRDNRNNLDKVSPQMDKATGEITAYRLHCSIPELTDGLRGKAAEGVLDELTELAAQPVRFFLNPVADSKERWQTGQIKAGLVQSFTRNTQPLQIVVHSLIMDVSKAFRMAPHDLRARWRKFSGERRIWHEMAWGWAWNQRMQMTEWGVDKLLQAWCIDRDKRNPKRTWDRLDSARQFLLETGIVRRDEVRRWVDGHPDKILFEIDPFESPSVRRHMEGLDRSLVVEDGSPVVETRSPVVDAQVPELLRAVRSRASGRGHEVI